MIGYSRQSTPHRDRARSFSYLSIVQLGVKGRQYGYDVDIVLCYAFKLLSSLYTVRWIVSVEMCQFPSSNCFLTKRFGAAAQREQQLIASTR
jgi:hypothetical protein